MLNDCPLCGSATISSAVEQCETVIGPEHAPERVLRFDALVHRCATCGCAFHGQEHEEAQQAARDKAEG